VLWALVVFMPASPFVTAAELYRPGVCEREGEKLLRRKLARVGKGLRTPKKTRDAKVAYPDLPPKTRGSGVWVGEVLLDTQGKVSQVWAIHEVQLTPPYPPFNQAIVDAIRQWEFEPVVVKTEKTPVCMAVVVNIILK
jgi:outer membrane biosynthesis protein TonB